MKVSYFPGCTLKNKAKDLDRYAYKSAAALGVTLEEIENWQCCGGVFTTARDEIATKLSSVRALMAAGERGQDLVTLCSACHHVIKRVNRDMQTDATICDRANRYMARTFLTEEAFREAFSAGCRELWQLAEYFDLPEADIRAALRYWTDCRGIDFTKQEAT